MDAMQSLRSVLPQLQTMAQAPAVKDAIATMRKLALKFQDTGFAQYDDADVEFLVAAVASEDGQPRQLIDVFAWGPRGAKLNPCLTVQITQLLLRIWQICTATTALSTLYAERLQLAFCTVHDKILEALDWIHLHQITDVVVKDGCSFMADAADAAVKLVAETSSIDRYPQGQQALYVIWQLILVPPVAHGECQ
jgi:hypothetical protein